jgi:hypothetical protein
MKMNKLKRNVGRPFGWQMPNEVKQKIAKSMTGKVKSKETKEKTSRTLRQSKNEIRKEVESEGYKILDIEYQYPESKGYLITYECPKGHTYSTVWNSWKHLGTRCGKCWEVRIVLHIDDVRKSFEEFGCTLISDSYINQHATIEYVENYNMEGLAV